MESLVVLVAMLVATLCGGLAALLSVLSWGEIRRASERAARDRARIERAVQSLEMSAAGPHRDRPVESVSHAGLRLVVLVDDWRPGATPARRSVEVVNSAEHITSPAVAPESTFPTHDSLAVGSGS